MLRRLTVFICIFLSLMLVTGHAENKFLMHPAELTTMMQEQPDAIYVDLRSEKDFNKIHIPGFVNLEYNEEAVRMLSKESRPICLICLSGVRSQKAGILLAEAGYTDVYVCTFGIADYANLVGEKQMEGADICLPCLKLMKE